MLKYLHGDVVKHQHVRHEPISWTTSPQTRSSRVNRESCGGPMWNRGKGKDEERRMPTRGWHRENPRPWVLGAYGGEGGFGGLVALSGGHLCTFFGTP